MRLTYGVQGKDSEGLFIWAFLSFTICIEFQTIFNYSNSKKKEHFFHLQLNILLKKSDLLLVTNVKLTLQLITSDKSSQTHHI